MKPERISIVSDDYINNLFSGSNFGEATNNCVKRKRKQIAKTLRDQVEGFWSGHTAYHIAVDGGFLVNAGKGVPKRLTPLGRAYLETYTES